ncbi:MAG TPA: DUF3232 domain-containing protein [Candidatus Pacearchaeota archaeon]|nr:DUF3232 domain-containing protein [Candidatus Pacearchaeota archaeon]
MEDKKIRKAMERRTQIEKILENDENGLRLLKGLTFSAWDYVNATVNFRAYISKLRDFDRCMDDLTETMVAMDLNKRTAHEALLSRLNSFNRYLFKEYPDSAPLGGIYSLEPPESIKDRHSVSEWAGHYVFGIENGSKINFK